mgnify:CR=1 FL=1
MSNAPVIDHDAHFDGDQLRIDPDRPFRLVIVIDNEDGEEYPGNPFTLNARILGRDSDESTDLVLAGEGSLVFGDVADQLRELADLIEQGRVER